MSRKSANDDTSPGNTASRAYVLGKEVFGRHGSGRADLSPRRKQFLREKLKARRRRA
jgi:hypothetical protein